MVSVDPYKPPQSKLIDSSPDQEYAEVTFFGNSRLGRVRYIAYSIGVAVLGFLLTMPASILLSETAGAIVILIMSGAMLVVNVLFTIRRAHDFNTTGWLALILIIPVVPIIFWFIPGTNGANRFGPMTPSNGVGVIAVACVVPAVFILGILFAIMVPAYQGYVERASEAQSTQTE